MAAKRKYKHDFGAGTLCLAAHDLRLFFSGEHGPLLRPILGKADEKNPCAI